MNRASGRVAACLATSEEFRQCAFGASPMKTTAQLITALAICFGIGQSHAQDGSTALPKRLSMIIGQAAGGGTDVTGRLVARMLSKHLPGEPTIVVRNMPGAGGITALNYMVHQTARDGETITFGANGVVDPFNYRKPQAQYDPLTFQYIGGVGRGGQFLVINKNALPRLYDKTKPPVIMGSVGNMPRSGMQVTTWCIEFLGWNAKWVTGYRGTNELMLALQRGEIDITATANFYQVEEMVRQGNFSVVIQSGTLLEGKIAPRPEFAHVPVFPIVMQGKISDPVARQAFDYWLAINTMDKWLGLIPGTPAAITKIYREAFAKVIASPEFVEQGTKISGDLTPMTHQDVEGLVKRLAATPPEATTYINTLLRKQGLQSTD
ncbi:MAG: hypothetical protein GEU95_26470 [Rhizobiales bacterium]|nr:hypothetical protein [Hyphomicrobiales bacterium]